ncbi:hypothetical protein Tco_0078889 [Tanacetum coccineum]
MANLEFCDKHNMVAYLKKPTGSEGFQEIVDFLNDSYIRQYEKRFSGENTPLLPSMIAIQEKEDEAVYKEWNDRVERAITTAASLDAEQAIGNINRTQSIAMPNVPLPYEISVGGSPRCQEAMGVPLLKIGLRGGELRGRLESKTKGIGVLITKLIKKVKKLEKTIKSNQARRRAKIVVSDDEEDLEDSSKQGRMIEEIDQDAGVTLVTLTHSQEDQPEDQLGVFSAAKVLADAAKENVHTYTIRRRVVSTGSGRISTASRLFSTAKESVSTTGASMPVSTAGIVQEVNISIPSPVVVKDKGKGKIEESEDEQTKRTKLQQEQERLSHEAVVRLQEELDEEERQRMARVHEVA